MMTRFQINIRSQEAARTICGIACRISDNVFIDDGDQLKVDAKAILGVMYAASEFKELFISSANSDIESYFKEYKI